MNRKRMRRLGILGLVFLMLGSFIPVYPGAEPGIALAGEPAEEETSGVLASDSGYFRLQNKHTGKYLYALDGKVAYGTPVETDPASHWLIEEHDGKQRIKNRATGLYMSVENWQDFYSPIELLPVGEEPAYAEWHILDAATEGYKVIQRAVNPEHYVHVEDNTGYAQASAIPPDWGTPQWAIEPVFVTVPYEPDEDAGPEYIRIKNDWLGLYIYDDNGQLKYGSIGGRLHLALDD